MLAQSLAAQKYTSISHTRGQGDTCSVQHCLGALHSLSKEPEVQAPEVEMLCHKLPEVKREEGSGKYGKSERIGMGVNGQPEVRP